jgi:RND family efflux transporter MFP subunit
MSKTFSRALVAGWTLAAAMGLAGCGQNAPQAQGGPPPAPAVTVAKPVQQMVSDYDEYVGRFVPVDSVEIRSRVAGYLDRIHFTDGQLVQQGDLLFTIDRRPFENALEQAKATLAQARANLAYAEGDLERASQLVRDRTVTQQAFDQRTQAKRVAEAAVAAQEALVRQATLDLQFTELRAPINGRIGDRRVSMGNLIVGGTAGNATMLATIMSIDPIRFEFTFDEASYLRYERAAQTGKDVTSREGSVVVSLKLIDEPEFKHQGRMDFVDNAIDRASGTIRRQRRVHAGHVRAHPRAGVGAIQRNAGTGRGTWHRPGEEVRPHGRSRRHGEAEIRHSRAVGRSAARHQGWSHRR